MSDASYLVDAVRWFADGDCECDDLEERCGTCYATEVVHRYDADIAAGRVPVIVDRETRDGVDVLLHRHREPTGEELIAVTNLLLAYLEAVRHTTERES